MNATTTHLIHLADRQLELQLADHTREIRCAAVATERSIRDMVRDAVTDPLEFPDLGFAILEEDLVAIALEAGVPNSESIVYELVAWLLERNLRPEQITVVLAAREEAALQSMRQALQSTVGIRIVPHAPQDTERLEYVAASETADPIYIQRDLVEAAVVLPIYCIRHPDALSASDLYAMCPGFADAKTQQRWNLAWLKDNEQHRHLQAKLSREAGWLMGIQFAIAVVPADGGSIAGMIGGDPEQVFRAATARFQEGVHEQASANKHDLIIATIDGDRDQQTWLNVARALVTAETMLTPAGCVLICCDLHHLSDGIAQLASDEPDDVLERELLESELEDAFAAAVVRWVQARRSVYLMAPIPAAQIELLGLAHVSGPEDIDRLAQRARSVCLLRSSQF